MLRVDLEAAGVPYEDESGQTGDFHAFRHTFITLLNQAGVPLATAQKLMRHSTPRHSTPMLMANTYTHVLVETKAEALAKLPSIIPAALEEESATRTGTDDLTVDSLLMDVAAKMLSEKNDSRNDSSGPDFLGKIETYRDFQEDGNALACAMTGNEKSPVPQGQTGDKYWRRDRDLNSGWVAPQRFSRPPP